MNITNLVTALQVAASNATTTINYMMLSKMIEKLSVGSVTTVATSSNLPSTLTTNGNVYYVTADQEHYYNVGATWKSLSGIYRVAYAFGAGTSGELGDNTTSNRSSPVTVVGNLLTWSSISAGSGHNLGVIESGIAYAWGNGSNGRLGDNTNIAKSSPVTVVGGITNWSQVSAGENHSLGVTTSGIAYAWGSAANGRLGDNTTVSKSSPVTVVGNITNWNRVSAGRTHSLGLTSTGILYAWGYNGAGRLGDNTTSTRSSPVTVVGGITTWSQVSASFTSSLGLTSGSIVYAWGSNDKFQLGDNTATASSKSSPVTVVGGITTWNQISSGSQADHNLAITTAGIAYAWGYNNRGQLGDNTVAAKSSPVLVLGGITNWNSVRTGTEHSIGTTSSGIAYAWGQNSSGQLGDASITSKRSPVTVVGGITNWSLLAAGGSHTIAIQSFTG